MQIWIDKYSVRKHFVTFRHLQAHASPGLTGSAPVRATYDPGRRPTAMAYEISTTIEIAATPENVWAVLADLASYPQWHPMYQAVTGQLAAGSTLTITSTHPTTGRTMTAKVKVLTAEPDTELRWVSKPLGVTISERIFRLSPTADGTSLVQTGSYRGLGGGRGRAITKVISRIQDAFTAINEAIKQQAEARQRASG